MKRFALYVGALAPDLVALLIGVVIRVLWGSRWYAQHGVLWIVLEPKSWPSRTWYRVWAGTTFGHVVMLSAIADHDVKQRTRRHELVHVEQYEGQVLRGLLAGLVLAAYGAYWAGLAVWVCSWWLYVLTNMLVAVLRGKPAYYGAAHEEHAYAANSRG